MDKIDPEKARQVWQRVQGATPTAPREQGLSELVVLEWTNATAYLQLSRHTPAKIAASLRHIHQQEMGNAACLKGIYTLLTGKKPAIKAVPPAPDSPDKVLRRCYGQEMHCLAQYEARRTDPEYGQVFARLAAQKQEHCRLVLELLGRLTGKA